MQNANTNTSIPRMYFKYKYKSSKSILLSTFKIFL